MHMQRVLFIYSTLAIATVKLAYVYDCIGRGTYMFYEPIL